MYSPEYPRDLPGQARLAVIRKEISGRLWPVNMGMDSVAYNQLMDQMALAQLSGERRQAREGMENLEAFGRAAPPEAEPL